MLTNQQQQNLINLIDHEINNFLCLEVPKYQSFNYMHIKHNESEELNLIAKNILLYSYTLTNEDLKIKTCWFNIAKKDSNYKYHKHNTLTAVYFLKGCTNNGTLIKKENLEFILPGTDNTIQFIGSDVDHSIPKWSGVDRYSIVFELCT